MSYNEYRRLGVDYYDITKKYLNSLTQDLNKIVDHRLLMKKNSDQTKIEAIIYELVNTMHEVYSDKSQSIIHKLLHIQQVNKNLVNSQNNYLKMVDNYFTYLNFAYFSNDSSQYKSALLQKIISQQYQGNLEIYNSLIGKYGFINKQKALVYNIHLHLGIVR